jgi:hypothetical protein
MYFDRIMDLSRGLLDVDDTFIHALQELLVAGQIKVRMLTVAGVQESRDPRVLTFDDPVCNDLDALAALIKTY